MGVFTGRAGRLAALLGLMSLVVAGGGSSAARADDPDKKIQQSKSEIDELSNDLKAADAQLKKTDAQVAAAHRKLTAANSDLSAARQRQKDAQDSYDLAQANQESALKSLAKNRADETSARVKVGGLARNSFETGGLGDLTFTVQVLTSKHDVSGTMALSDVIMRRQQSVITDLRSSAAAGAAENARLAEERRRASLAKTKQDAAVRAAVEARGRAANAETKLKGLRTAQKDDKVKLESEKKKEEQKLAALEAESDRIKKLTSGGRLDPTVADGVNEGGFLRAPAPTSSIVSGFGYRFHPVLRIQKLHAGVDYPFACGTPVFAASSGTVVEANYNPVSGNHAVISHGTVNGMKLSTAYMHFTSLTVGAGQKVLKGQQIGVSGMTGRVTGCHLHFEVRENGVAVDPLKWIQ